MSHVPDPYEPDPNELAALLDHLADTTDLAAMAASGRSHDPTAGMLGDDDDAMELDLQALRRAYEAGATLNDLARQLGLGHQVVRAFIVAAGGRIRVPRGGRRRQRIRVVGNTSPEQIAVIAAAVAGAAEVERDDLW